MVAIAPVSKLVKVKVGKNIPSLNANIGDEIEVTEELATSLREKRFLLEQTQEDAAQRAAGKNKRVAEEESRLGTDQRRIILSLETKLQVSRESEAKLSKQLLDAQLALETANKRADGAQAELLRVQERSGKGLSKPAI